MVPRDHLINKIRELDYYFIERTKKGTLWRKRGGTYFLVVPLREMIREDTVASLLRQARCSPQEIESFLSSAKN